MVETIRDPHWELTAILEEDGRVALPTEVRAALHLEAGDAIVFELDSLHTDQATLRVASLSQIVAAAVARVGRPLDPQEINRIVEEEVVREYLEEMQRANEVFP